MTKYTADATVTITVTFEDDGESGLLDQALEAVWNHRLCQHTDDAEVHRATVMVLLA